MTGFFSNRLYNRIVTVAMPRQNYMTDFEGVQLFVEFKGIKNVFIIKIKIPFNCLNLISLIKFKMDSLKELRFSG